MDSTSSPEPPTTLSESGMPRGESRPNGNPSHGIPDSNGAIVGSGDDMLPWSEEYVTDFTQPLCPIRCSASEALIIPREIVKAHLRLQCFLHSRVLLYVSQAIV